MRDFLSIGRTLAFFGYAKRIGLSDVVERSVERTKLLL